jgi:hypothetical protein
MRDPNLDGSIYGENGEVNENVWGMRLYFPQFLLNCSLTMLAFLGSDVNKY